MNKDSIAKDLAKPYFKMRKSTYDNILDATYCLLRIYGDDITDENLILGVAHLYKFAKYPKDVNPLTVANYRYHWRKVRAA